MPAIVGDYLKFMLFHLVGLGAIASFVAGGVWIPLGFVAILGFCVLGDLLAGDDTTTPSYGEPWIMTEQPWRALPIVSGIVFAFLWTLAPGDTFGFGAMVTSLTGYDVLAAKEATGLWARYLGGTILTGFIIGALATITAHELTHRTWDPVSLWIGRCCPGATPICAACG